MNGWEVYGIGLGLTAAIVAQAAIHYHDGDAATLAVAMLFLAMTVIESTNRRAVQ